MSISTQLFDSEKICLRPIGHEVDAIIESAWSHDPTCLRAMGQDIARPLSPEKIKKKYEALEKEMEGSENAFYFTIRKNEGNRLLGFVRIYWIEWSQGTGSDAINTLLRYVFLELNLSRITLIVFEYNPRAIRAYEKCGFVMEGCVREVMQREGRRWDWYYMGIFREEWEQITKDEIS